MGAWGGLCVVVPTSGFALLRTRYVAAKRLWSWMLVNVASDNFLGGGVAATSLVSIASLLPGRLAVQACAFGASSLA